MPGVAEIFRGAGCADCRGTGFRGRLGIYELLVLDEALRAEVGGQRTVAELRRMGIDRGMRTLREDGLRQVRAGVTTVEEVLRVTQG